MTPGEQQMYQFITALGSTIAEAIDEAMNGQWKDKNGMSVQDSREFKALMIHLQAIMKLHASIAEQARRKEYVISQARNEVHQAGGELPAGGTVQTETESSLSERSG